jgi:transcriptional regulator with XRE-family HTH domain
VSTSSLTLASSLRRYRDENLLTQEELARQLGISTRALQSYEAGALPRPSRRRKILAFLADQDQAAA